MRLVVSEKNIAARRIAEILAVGKPQSDKVYSTPVYRFRRDGEDWVSIGLKGHITEVDFPPRLLVTEEGWSVEHADGKLEPADMNGLPVPDDADEAIALDKWKLDALPYLARAPIEKLPQEKGIIQSLKNLARKADDVIIATDFDREGELIGSDAAAYAREANAKAPIHRVRFSAITKGEIERAFAEIGEISVPLAEAGATRQEIDLAWGAALTRFLTLALQTKTRRPYGDVLSSGRVQTPTLKLIIDREAERDAFIPEDYWVLKARFSKDAEEFDGTHATDRFKVEGDARAALAAVESAREGRVAAVKTSRRTVAPPAPFNTTSLMAAAAAEGMSPAQTMRVAESLYMSGLISYPRVDNTVYPASLDLAGILGTLARVPAYAEHAKRLLGGPLKPTRGAKETTDHPPIHPTGAADTDKLDGAAWKLYNLVSRRFMATLSEAAVVEGTRVDIDVAGERFVAKGDVIVKPGFRAVYHYGLKKDEHLPAMAEGESVAFLGAQLEAKQTQPPARYSQGKLIQEMEKLGLGTKATRHDIIQGLYDRKYVSGDPMEPTFKGKSVVEALVKHAPLITTPEMTSDLEAEMDAIANGRETRARVVGHSRQILGSVIDALVPLAEDVGEALKSASDEDAKVGKCPESGHDLLIKFSPKTRKYFVGCSGYPECSVTYPLPANAKYAATDEPCPVCGTPQVRIIQFKQRPRLMCLSTECPTKKGPEIVVAKGGCPTGDGGDLVVRYSPVGKRYIRCTNYEECKTSYPLPQNGELEATEETCECGAPMVIVHTRKGPWKICANPDCPTKEKTSRGRSSSRGSSSRGGTKRSPSRRKRT